MRRTDVNAARRGPVRICGAMSKNAIGDSPAARIDGYQPTLRVRLGRHFAILDSQALKPRDWVVENKSANGVLSVDGCILRRSSRPDYGNAGRYPHS